VFHTQDSALSEVLGRSECRWVSYTEGDKAYGSEVVERVLTASNLPDTARQADMLLLPMDSIAYAQQGLFSACRMPPFV
jgi:hypothetical protein